MVKEISLEKAQEIVKNRMPFGRFIAIGDYSFIAIENTSGDAQVEHFITLDAAIVFLNA